jgi:hypothetical protein
MARLTAAQKVRRDAEIVADRARGLTWPTIAERNRISERQARRAWTDWIRRAPLEAVDPLRALQDAVAQLDALVEDLVLLAESTANDSVRLGAIKSRWLIIADRFRLMSYTGLLPRDLGLYRTELDARRLVDAIFRAFDEHAVSRDAREAVLAALRSESLRQNGSAVVRPTGQ